MMKYFKLSFISLLLVTLLSGCDSDLPYEDRTETAVFDIVRTPGTKGIIEGGVLEGKYGINLTHTEMFGDLSTLDYIQLACVYYPNKTDEDYLSKAQNKVIIDEIRDFSTRGIEFELKDLYAKFGLTIPVVGEEFTFVINTVLNDGTVIPGWTLYQVDGKYKETYNNQGFVAWEIDGRSYSYAVTYAVTCPFDINQFVGEASVVDWSAFGNVKEEYDVTISKVSETELLINGMFDQTVVDVKVTINPEDQSLSFPKSEVFAPSFLGYANAYLVAGKGNVKTCTRELVLNASIGVSVGTFGAGPITISMK